MEHVEVDQPLHCEEVGMPLECVFRLGRRGIVDGVSREWGERESKNQPILGRRDYANPV